MMTLNLLFSLELAQTCANARANTWNQINFPLLSPTMYINHRTRARSTRQATERWARILHYLFDLLQAGTLVSDSRPPPRALAYIHTCMCLCMYGTIYKMYNARCTNIARDMRHDKKKSALDDIISGNNFKGEDGRRRVHATRHVYVYVCVYKHKYTEYCERSVDMLLAR